MITIRALNKSFGTVDALHNISFDIPDKSFFGIIGESGAGKSTLLKCINRLVSYDSGTVHIDNIDIANLDEVALREIRSKMGMIFQNFALLDQKSIFKNIALPLECWGYPRNHIRERVEELAHLVGIHVHLDKRPRELSGGQKQRVAIARALAIEPKYILCDECTSALDPKNARMIMNLLSKIQEELGVTVIVVTHDMPLAKKYCNRIALLENGHLLDVDEKKRIIANHPGFFQTDSNEGGYDV